MTASEFDTTAADPIEWRSYEEFAAGIDTYRLPSTSLRGASFALTLEDDSTFLLTFGVDTVRWTGTGEFSTATLLTDPYDAVRVRPDVVFVHLPLESREREAISLVYSETTHRALVVLTEISAEETNGEPRVRQRFWSGVSNAGPVAGTAAGPSRDLIGKRNLYRYSPQHLYEHVYISSERYAWQCVQGVQRGHGDMDMSTVWKFEDGLYLFCFREFRIPVASIWIHDLSYALRTTGSFLGLTKNNTTEHSRGGGHIYPLGSVSYPDAQPV